MVYHSTTSATSKSFECTLITSPAAASAASPSPFTLSTKRERSMALSPTTPSSSAILVSSTVLPAAIAINKCALSFILWEAPNTPTSPIDSSTTAEGTNCLWASASDATQGVAFSSSSRSNISESKDNYGTINTSLSVKKGRRFCIVDGCKSLGKHNKHCWRHGGSIKCKVPFCTNRAKSKGLCWSHGGGTLCTLDDCGTIAVSKGLCWAHGGGKRCKVRHCAKSACERTHNHCAEHFRALRTDRGE